MVELDSSVLHEQIGNFLSLTGLNATSWKEVSSDIIRF